MKIVGLKQVRHAKRDASFFYMVRYILEILARFEAVEDLCEFALEAAVVDAVDLSGI